MSDVMQKVPDNDPLMLAWKAFQATEEYANAHKWAQYLQVVISEGPSVQVQAPHLDGSLWGVFMAGFIAGCAQGKPTDGPK